MKEQPELKVYREATDDLLPYANNAKIHTREQVDQIASSIEEFGFNDPIAVWHNDEGQMEIVEGHGRVMAAKKLGLQWVPVVYLDHLSNEQRRAYTHIHNQLTMNTEFDWDMLDQELEEIGRDDWANFGFESTVSVDWASVQDLDESSYERPEHDMLVCPQCGHEDRKEHFKKA